MYKGRRLPSLEGRRRNGQRRSGSWTKRILRSSVGWRWGGVSDDCQLLPDFSCSLSRTAWGYTSDGQLQSPYLREGRLHSGHMLLPSETCQGSQWSGWNCEAKCWRSFFCLILVRWSVCSLRRISHVHSDLCPCLQEAALRREQKKLEKKQMKMKQIKVKAMWLPCEKHLSATCRVLIDRVQISTELHNSLLLWTLVAIQRNVPCIGVT